MDSELRLSFYVSSFPEISILCSVFHDLSRILSLPSSCRYMGAQTLTKRKLMFYLSIL